MPSGKFSLPSGESESSVSANENSPNEDKNVDAIKMTDMDGDVEQDPQREFPPPFAGMGKDMVLHYSDTPGWNRARKILLIFFWSSWFILLGAVIFLTVTHQRCKLTPVREWWQAASIYQVYPRSFKDSDGDGLGDLNGILEKLDYLKDVNVDAVWISPFYKSPMSDFGYDVSDYRDIDPEFGTMADFDRLLKEMHSKGLKLIIDFIPNHTSEEHDWFQRSIQSEMPYKNYYVWEDCGNGTDLPNNWVSVLGEPAWTYNAVRQQCYFHQYQVTMPDLNIRNNRVKNELDDVLKFWLDKGVDGIRVDAIVRLYEDYNLEDEVLPAQIQPGENIYKRMDHNKTRDLPEIMDMINRWRGILDGYTRTPRVMITEAYGDPSDLKMYYGRTKDGGAHLPFNFQLAKITKSCDAFCIRDRVKAWIDNMPENATANWVLGNHDVSRISSRFGEAKSDAMNMLLLLLPGVSTTYYGDELGMTNIDISGRESVDPVGKENISYSRDPERSPMQWTSDESQCYGFTSNCSISWLPVHPNASKANVEEEESDIRSHLTVYKNLTKLRAEDSFIYGDWKEHITTKDIYSFLRFYDGMNTYLIVVNIGDDIVEIDLTEGIPDDVTLGSVAAITGSVVDYKLKQDVELNKVKLQPGDGVVFTWAYVVKQLEL